MLVRSRKTPTSDKLDKLGMTSGRAHLRACKRHRHGLRLAHVCRRELQAVARADGRLLSLHMLAGSQGLRVDLLELGGLIQGVFISHA